MVVMTAWRGGLAGALLTTMGALASAAAEPIPDLGIDLSSSDWVVADAARRLVRSPGTGLVLELDLFAQATTQRCQTIARTVRDSKGAPLPAGFAKGDVGGSIPDQWISVCRVAGARTIVVRGELREQPWSAAEVAAIQLLLADSERAIARQRTLVLPGSELDLGPRFDRWQVSPVLFVASDTVTRVAADGPELSVQLHRIDDACIAYDGLGADEGSPRPTLIPAAYAALARSGRDGDATTVTTCLAHGQGGYEVTIERTDGATRAQTAAADADVTDLLVGFAAAVAKSPPLAPDGDDQVDSTTGASWDEDEDDATPTPAPTPAPDPPVAEAAVSPDALPGYAPDISTFTSSHDDDDHPTGLLPTSRVLMLRGRRLAIDASAGVMARDALGAELAFARPLALAWDDFDYEWGATVGYDAVSGVTYDVRVGGGAKIAGALALLAGGGLDGWTGDAELPGQPYLYVGARLPIGPLAVRAEYLPRNGGDDESRLRATYTRYRGTHRKIAVEGSAIFIGDATVLALGVGVGL